MQKIETHDPHVLCETVIFGHNAGMGDRTVTKSLKDSESSLQRKAILRDASRNFSVDDILAEPDYIKINSLPKVSLSDILDDDDIVVSNTVPTRIDPVDIDSDTDEELKKLIAEAKKQTKIRMPELIQQGFQKALKVDKSAVEDVQQVEERQFVPLRPDIKLVDLQADVEVNKQHLLHSLKSIEGLTNKEIRDNLDASLKMLRENDEGAIACRAMLFSHVQGGGSLCGGRTD